MVNPGILAPEPEYLVLHGCASVDLVFTKAVIAV